MLLPTHPNSVAVSAPSLVPALSISAPSPGSLILWGGGAQSGHLVNRCDTNEWPKPWAVGGCSMAQWPLAPSSTLLDRLHGKASSLFYPLLDDFAPLPMLMFMAWSLGEGTPREGRVTRRATSPFCSRGHVSARDGSGVGAPSDSLDPGGMVAHSLLQRSRLSFPTEYLVSYEFISSITFLMGPIRIFFVRETQEACPCPPPVHTLGSCSGRAPPLFRDLTFTTLCVPHTLPL